MKNKSFDCVEMKRKGAEVVYQKVACLSIEQQLEYWRKGSDKSPPLKPRASCIIPDVQQFILQPEKAFVLEKHEMHERNL